MPRNELDSVQKDDSLILVKYSGQRTQSVSHVTVRKAGPVWLTVIGDTPHAREERYRRDNRTDGSGYDQHGMVYTMAEWEEITRKRKARAYLSEQGIDLKFSSTWYDRPHELADLLRSVIQPDA